MLPLALGMAGALAKGQPLKPECWRLVHKKLKEIRTKFRDVERGALFATIDASSQNLPQAQKHQFQLMAVLASGLPATQDMLANLWETVCQHVCPHFLLNVFETIQHVLNWWQQRLMNLPLPVHGDCLYAIAQ